MGVLMLMSTLELWQDWFSEQLMIFFGLAPTMFGIILMPHPLLHLEKK